MNILIDLLPTTVDIEGIEYEINSDFRTSILFSLLMEDDEVSNEDKINNAFNLFYPKIPHNLVEASKKMVWFYCCGKETNNMKSNGSRKEISPIYSFEYDDEYIYSAFLSQYNIDLQDVEYLHWWKFKAMFKGLKEDNEIVKIMGYRSMDLSKVDKTQKDRYKKLKKMYELPKNKSEIETISKIEEALLNGDLSNIL